MWLDRLAARRWFERAAATVGRADHLAREVDRRMAARLEYVKHRPSRIIEVGCGAGSGLALLRGHYPDADIYAIDYALAMVERARAARPTTERIRSLLRARRLNFLCADMSALPFAKGACGMLWSNLTLAWSTDCAQTLREWHRVLEVGGLLMFSTYGPDTLKELRAAFGADAAPHVHPFVDLHDLGDTLAGNGFADPVMDMDIVTVTYDSVKALAADLRASGERNALAARRRGLTGRDLWRRMMETYSVHARAGRIPATFEIVYGHAWKAAPKATADGRAIIHFDRARRSEKAD